jgi:hypothetical protein
VISDKVRFLVFLLYDRNPSTCSSIRRTSICKKHSLERVRTTLALVVVNLRSKHQSSRLCFSVVLELNMRVPKAVVAILVSSLMRLLSYLQ